MELQDQAVALYGRFSAGVREHLQREIERRGGRVARDLTLRSDIFVVGALAVSLVDGGALSARLKSAGERGVPVMSERRFAAALSGEAASGPATLALATALAPTGLSRGDAEVLAAFDLIALAGDLCRFGDASTIRTAGELARAGRSRADIVRILTRARDLSPLGRHKIVITPAGDAALQWDDGLTTLEGQGYLPLDIDHASVDELFEAAEMAEASGDLDGAMRLYDMCGRTDRTDAIAPFNMGNIFLSRNAPGNAVLAYQRALSRDPRFIEARYNLALALEALGRADAAADELIRVLDADPRHADAIFNLAQLRMKADEMGEAKALYERYLALDPPADWAMTARKAITYCTARLSA